MCLLSLTPPRPQDMTHSHLETVRANKILAKVGKSKSPKNEIEKIKTDKNWVSERRSSRTPRHLNGTVSKSDRRPVPWTAKNS